MDNGKIIIIWLNFEFYFTIILDYYYKNIYFVDSNMAILFKIDGYFFESNNCILYRFCGFSNDCMNNKNLITF